ncbi:legumain [Elysia marginata]|uniref:Legumain n=1 Tax=Elysia marginata TaxID=1093978 RepID=A0AAV4EEQ9_9GAST|nr:legumain [Elysia marginata]
MQTEIEVLLSLVTRLPDRRSQGRAIRSWEVVPDTTLNMKLPILLLLCFVSSVAAGKNWAMLFTGAHDWENYSTHSNLCHAYHVLHKAGIPDERIVVVMYNDIADNPLNPFPGKLFNNYNNTDVYRGTPMDYTGKEVTADLVLAVLKGDKATVKNLIGREGKVVDSGPKDNVFVAVSDHGAPGVLLMPDRLMHAKELNAALRYMHSNKKFANLIFYLESCESGSMFKNLPKNVYALTAAGKDTDAYMNYCFDPKIKGICIGGQFSTAWIENSGRVDLNTFTFRQQATAIEKHVNRSHPLIFGDHSLLDRPLIDFFGSRSRAKRILTFTDLPHTPQGSNAHTAPFHSMELTLLKRQIEKNPSDIELRLKLSQLQKLRSVVDRFYALAVRHVYMFGSSTNIHKILTVNNEPIGNWDCYEAAVNAVSASCNGLVQHRKVQGYFLSRLSVLVNICNRETGPDVVGGVRVASKATALCR